MTFDTTLRTEIERRAGPLVSGSNKIRVRYGTSDRGRDKDGELKSERALSSRSRCYKEQDSDQVVPFGVDQGFTHETSVIIEAL